MTDESRGTARGRVALPEVGTDLNGDGAEPSGTFGFMVCYDRDLPRINDDVFTSIETGRARALDALGETIGDDTGDHISGRDGAWKELTILYWMWKNLEAEYYGLFHAQHMLDLTLDDTHDGFFHSFSPEAKARFGWNRETIDALCQEFDLILPTRLDVHPVGLPDKCMCNYAFYNREFCGADLDQALDVVKGKSPSVYPYLLRYLYSNQHAIRNVAIASRPFFHRYAEWLFDVLFECERRSLVAGGSRSELPKWHALAEILGGAFFTYLEEQEGARVGLFDIMQGIFTMPPSDIPVLTADEHHRRRSKPATDDTINIAFASDETYIAHCGTAIKSLLGRTSATQALRIFILHDGSLTAESTGKLESLFTDNPNATLHLVEVDSAQFAPFPQNRPYISIVTYFRLALHNIVPNDVRKILYLDCDIVVEADIADLWRIDLGDRLIAGCPDEGDLYQISRLQLTKGHQYFNAGVCIFNLDLIRTMDIDQVYLKAYALNQDLITLQDQDILNIAFDGRSLALPLAWNVNGRVYMINELEYSYDAATAEHAARHPAIVHFTDTIKPWHAHCRHPLRALYWDWRSRTPWADPVAAAESLPEIAELADVEPMEARVLEEELPVDLSASAQPSKTEATPVAAVLNNLGKAIGSFFKKREG